MAFIIIGRDSGLFKTQLNKVKERNSNYSFKIGKNPIIRLQVSLIKLPVNII